MIRRLLVVAVVLACPEARANVAAPIPPDEISAIGSEGTALEVRSAALRIDCATAESCRLEATYEVVNPGAAPAGGVAVFYAEQTQDVSITVDGAPANTDLTPAQLAPYDAAVDGTTEHDHRREYGRQAFAIEVTPGGAARVVVAGTLHPRSTRHRGYDISPVRARHLMLTQNDGASLDRVRLRYPIAPIRTWAAFPAEMSFSMTHPAAWQPTVWGGSVTARTEGAMTVHTGTLPTSLDELSIDLLRDEPFRLRGGMFVALGGHVDNATGVRARLGGEIGWGENRLISLAAEVETGDELGVVIVPALAIASPMVIFIPSLSVGVGVPVRVTPDVDIGGRLQLDAHFGPVGYFVAFDYYPSMDADPRRFQVAMMFQLSL